MWDPDNSATPYLESLTLLSLYNRENSELQDISKKNFETYHLYREKTVENRTSNAAQDALNPKESCIIQKEDIYNRYKEKLESKMSFHRLLNDVKKSKSVYKLQLSTSKKVAEAMTNMLDAQAKAEMQSWTPLFFQRLSNLFTFGFKLDSEYAKQLIREMEGFPSEGLRTDLTKAIYHSPVNVTPKNSIKDLKEKYNALDKHQFKILVEDVIFLEKEKTFEKSTNKFTFFENLTDEKKNDFIDIILLREDWFIQLYEMSRNMTKEGSDKVANELVTYKVIEKFNQYDEAQKNKWLRPLIEKDACNEIFSLGNKKFLTELQQQIINLN